MPTALTPATIRATAPFEWIITVATRGYHVRHNDQIVRHFDDLATCHRFIRLQKAATPPPPPPLTPHQLVADILALHKMLAAPGLDPATVTDLKGRVVDHWEALGSRVTTGYDDAFWGDRWFAYFGDYDADLVDGRYESSVIIGYGATEDEALERLLELTGEDVDA